MAIYNYVVVKMKIEKKIIFFRSQTHAWKWIYLVVQPIHESLLIIFFHNIMMICRMNILFLKSQKIGPEKSSLQCRIVINHVVSLVAQMVKNLPAMQETRVLVPVREDPLEKGKATHSSILAWRIPWTEEPGGLQSTGLQGVRQLSD